jgi:hypothetical protein
MSGLLFITATEINHKDINVALLHLRNWENLPDDDSFKLVTTKNAYELEPQTAEGTTAYECTSPPVPVGIDNAWAGASLEDVEAYCLELDRAGNSTCDSHLFVLIDDQGFAEKSCILAERAMDYGDQDVDIAYPERFNKIRLPWDDTYSIWCSLDTSNIGWDECVVDEYEDEDGKAGDGWFTYAADSYEISAEYAELRDAAIERMRLEGKA